jgi:serine/threonine protein phosphatase PrpC
MKHVAFGLSDVGRKRAKNEDSMLMDSDAGLYVVCDGMGGAACGEVASRMACDAIGTHIRENAQALKAYADNSTVANRSEALRVCDAAIQRACREVYEFSRKDDAKKGMGTTCVLMVLAGGSAITAHVGDSRIYMLRKGKVYLMTQDHCFVSERLRKGQITPEEAAKSQYSNVLTRNLGFQESVQVDMLNFELVPGDRYLLCSDGLSDYFESRDLTAVLANAGIDRVPQALVNLANERGGKDNITCVVVRIEEEPESTALTADKKIEALQKLSIFKELDYLEMIKLLNVMFVRDYEAGDPIIREGEASDRLFILLSGRVEVTMKGRKLAHIEPGSFFGEMGLIDKSPRSADVIALEPARVLFIPADSFQSLLNRESQISRKILWSFCEALNKRLRATNHALIELSPEAGEVGDVVDGQFIDI